MKKKVVMKNKNWEFEPKISGEGTVESPNNQDDTFNDAVVYDAKESSGEQLTTDLPEELPELDGDSNGDSKPVAAEFEDEVVPLELKESKKQGFNASANQHALEDSDDEGGIVKPDKNKNIISSGVIIPPLDDNTDKGISMYGFSIEDDDGAVVEVDKIFTSTDLAMQTISKSKYLHVENGEPVFSDIIDGEPRISIGDVEKNRYINGQWEKSK